MNDLTKQLVLDECMRVLTAVQRINKYKFGDSYVPTREEQLDVINAVVILTGVELCNDEEDYICNNYKP